MNSSFLCVGGGTTLFYSQLEIMSLDLYSQNSTASSPATPAQKQQIMGLLSFCNHESQLFTAEDNELVTKTHMCTHIAISYLYYFPGEYSLTPVPYGTTQNYERDLLTYLPTWEVKSRHCREEFIFKIVLHWTMHYFSLWGNFRIHEV